MYAEGTVYDYDNDGRDLGFDYRTKAEAFGYTNP